MNMINKVIGTCLLAIAAAFNSSAQYTDNFGKLNPADIEVKECAFDPSASLVVLLDEGSTDYNSVGDQVLYQHVRMKVLRKEGIDFAKYSFVYPGRWDLMQMDLLEAKCINVDEDGKLHEYNVDNSNIFTQKISKYLKKISFAYPQVKVGSILEYRYRITYSGMQWTIQPWKFQRDIPVYKSSYRYKTRPEVEVSYALQKKAEYPVSITREGKGEAVRFEMNNVPALPDEPYMDSRENYLQQVRFNITRISKATLLEMRNKSWNDLADLWEDHKHFGVFLSTVNRELNIEVGSITKGKAPLEKMRAIHEYVKQNIKYNGVQRIFADRGLVEMWHDKTGNSADINLLLVYMLRSAGLQADPVLICESSYGKIQPMIIDPDQFTNTYACVTIDGKKYYLDGTDKNTPAHLIQKDILNTIGLLIKGRTAELVTIEEPLSRNKRSVVVEGFIQEDGSVIGKVQVTSNDYARMLVKSSYNDNKDDYASRQHLKGLINVKVDSFQISNVQSDSLPIIENFNYTTALTHSGDYDFAMLNLFTGLNVNPFTAESRVSDVNFAYKTTFTITNVLSLPANKTIDAIPKNIQLVNEDKTLLFSRQVVYNEQSNQVVARMKFEINKSVFRPDQYSDLKEFFKKVSNLLEDQCVIKNR